MMVGICVLTSSMRRPHSRRMSAGQLEAAHTRSCARSARSLRALSDLSAPSLAPRQSAVVGSAAWAGASTPAIPAATTATTHADARTPSVLILLEALRLEVLSPLAVVEVIGIAVGLALGRRW